MNEKDKVFKVSKSNLDMIDILNDQDCGGLWFSRVRDVVPYDDEYVFISVFVCGNYPYMDNKLQEEAQKLLNTEKGVELCINYEWFIFDEKWLTQDEFYEKNPKKETLPSKLLE